MVSVDSSFKVLGYECEQRKEEVAGGNIGVKDI